MYRNPCNVKIVATKNINDESKDVDYWNLQMTSTRDFWALLNIIYATAQAQISGIGYSQKISLQFLSNSKICILENISGKFLI